jgi:DNA-binding NtrC family response regulator
MIVFYSDISTGSSQRLKEAEHTTMARILIIDDEESVRITLSKTLKAARHDIHEASDGDVALKILTEQKIDLVITDIVMPNREGVETMRAIRANWPRIKVIAMSGGERIRTPEFLKEAGELGVSELLKKPFSMSELQHTVSTVLDHGLSRGE